jgi:hypothetical protein
VKANELSPLLDEEESAFFHAFSTVPPCETEEPDRIMTAEENRDQARQFYVILRKILKYQNVNVAGPHRLGW